MARFGSEKIRGHGMPEAIEAILEGESRVAPRVAVLKPISAAMSIGTGGPFGAEGPIIMTGGAGGSILLAVELLLFEWRPASARALDVVAGRRRPESSASAATAAYAVSTLLLKGSVLTEKIARRGLQLTREYSVDPLELMVVGEVMEPHAGGDVTRLLPTAYAGRHPSPRRPPLRRGRAHGGGGRATRRSRSGHRHGTDRAPARRAAARPPRGAGP